MFDVRFLFALLLFCLPCLSFSVLAIMFVVFCVLCPFLSVGLLSLCALLFFIVYKCVFAGALSYLLCSPVPFVFAMLFVHCWPLQLYLSVACPLFFSGVFVLKSCCFPCCLLLFLCSRQCYFCSWLQPLPHGIGGLADLCPPFGQFVLLCFYLMCLFMCCFACGVLCTDSFCEL